MLTASVAEHNKEIMGIQEYRYDHSELDSKYPNTWTFVTEEKEIWWPTSPTTKYSL